MLAFKITGKTLAGFVVSVFCSALNPQLLLAQSLAELQDLVFYPSPLQIQDSPAPLAANALSGELLFALAEDGAMGLTDSMDPMNLMKEPLDLLQQPSPIGKYQQSIAQVEASEGPFAPALFQNLFSLGQLYQQQHDHTSALETFERAAAISRINNGLYAPEQISLTERMIDSLVATEQFAAVEDKYQFLVHLHQQYYGAAAPQTAGAMRGLGEWKLQAFQNDLLLPDNSRMLVARENDSMYTDYEVYSDRFDGLHQAQETFLKAIRLLIESEAYSAPELYELEQDLITTFFINANRELVLNAPQNYALTDEASATPVKNKNHSHGLPEDYRKGQNAYLRLIGYLKLNPQATMHQLSDALLGLADWHLMFGKYQRAEEQYDQLEALLIKARMDEAQIAGILQPEVPTTLPVFLETAISAKPLADETAYKGYVDVALDLNRYGHVSGVSKLGSSEGTSEDIEARLISLIRNAQFRPAQGPAASTGIRYYYSY